MNKQVFFYREQQIIEWGAARNIVGEKAQSTAIAQLLKTQKEFNEWLENHSKDDIGDIFVTLSMVASFYGFTLGEAFCVGSQLQEQGQLDFTEIKDSIKENGLDETYQACIDLAKQSIESDDGDTLFVDLIVLVKLLYNLAESIEANVNECIDEAWDDIKHRQGKMVSGLYVKQKDIDLLESYDIKYCELYEQPCFVITNPFSVDGIAKLKEIGFAIKDNRTIGLESNII
jgi:hypothetical protein